AGCAGGRTCRRGAALPGAARAAVGFLDRLGQKLSSLVDDVALPAEARERVELAAALLERGDGEAARAELEAVVEGWPEYVRAWHLLGIARWRGGHRAGAAEAFERAGDAASLVALGDVYREDGHADGAADALRRALEL